MRELDFLNSVKLALFSLACFFVWGLELCLQGRLLFLWLGDGLRCVFLRRGLRLDLGDPLLVPLGDPGSLDGVECWATQI